MNKWLRVLGALVGIASISYFLVFAHDALTGQELPATWSPPMLGATALAAVGYASVVPTSSWAWGRLLRSMGVPVQTLQLNMIMGLTQIAKYLPGNVGQHLGRSAMSIHRGIPLDALLVSLAAEVLLTILAATVVGGLGLAVHHRGSLGSTGLPRAATLAALGAAACLVALMVAIRCVPVLVRRFLPGRGTPSGPAPRATALSAAFAAYTVNYVVIGTGLFAVASAAAGVPAQALPLFIGALSLAWVLGFVAPGAPAGLGVREGALAVLLSPILSGPSALTVIVAYRIATTLGELLALAWGGALRLLELRGRRT